MMKISERFQLLLVVYFVAVPLEMIFMFLRILRRVRVKGRLPVFKDGLIIVYNHPSFLDPVFVVLLHFPRFLINPFRFFPLSVPNKKEYYDKIWFFLLRFGCIPVNSGLGVNKGSFTSMIKVLGEKRRIAFPPEGGRTDKGNLFFYSKKGKKIRKLQEGVGLLTIKTNSKILPVWLEIQGQEFVSNDISFTEVMRLIWQLLTKSKIIIKIGKPFEVQAKRRQEATKEVADTLLKLADEE